MNDFQEIEQGFDCLKATIEKEKDGMAFKSVIDYIFPNIFERVAASFDKWLPHFRHETFILSISEHSHESESKLGRLSMWRAYGGKNPVAIVIQPKALFLDTDALATYAHPVQYRSPEQFQDQLYEITTKIDSNKDLFLRLGAARTEHLIFEFFKTIVFTTKHPGFEEEREWRLVYNPAREPSPKVRTEIECISGIPQPVSKIKLQDAPEENLIGVTISNLIDYIIIGPSDQQSIIRKAFQKLMNCNINDIDKVRISGIPFLPPH
jgi:hypothetical protein